MAYRGIVHFPRYPAQATPNPLTLRLEAMRAEGTSPLDLTLSNPTRAGFDYPADAIRQALGAAEVLAYAPDPRGSLSAREAVAAHHQHPVEASSIHLCASTSEAYGWLFKVHGAPGDEVLVPAPSYPLFDHLASLEGLSTRAVASWFHDRWHLDIEALESACTDRTRLVVVVNPNNPTGHYLSRSEWRALTALCARRRLTLIVDEVFADFPLERPSDALTTALEDPHPECPVYVLSGLSKTALLPQVKLGWILSLGPHRAARMEALDYVADQLLSVSASAQAAAPELLRLAPGLRSQVTTRAKRNVHALDQALRPYPSLGRLPVEGGWSVLLKRPVVEDDEACAMRLLEGGVWVHPGHFFDLPTDGYVVLSLLTPEHQFLEGLSRILPLLRS